MHHSGASSSASSSSARGRRGGWLRAFLQILELDKRVLLALTLLIGVPYTILYFQLHSCASSSPANRLQDESMLVLQTKVAALEQIVYAHHSSLSAVPSSSSSLTDSSSATQSCQTTKNGITPRGGSGGPGRRVAVVMPIYRPMWERAIQGIMNWKKDYNYPACNTSLGYQKKVDLILFTNKYFGDTKEDNDVKLNQIVGLLQSMGIAKCFGEIVFANAALDDETDPEQTRNNIAISAMFWKLFRLDELKDYDYFFHMESDTRPIRPYWRDLLYEEIEFSHDEFWIMGTLYRGPNNPKEW